MSPSRVREGHPRGYIIPIGGAEKVQDPAILKRYVKLCGGRHARIAIIPTASLMSDTGKRYEALFDELGAESAEAFHLEERTDGADADTLKKLERCTGVFFTGGNQLRLATHLGGTPVAKTIRILNARGVHVAGTSAGAAFLSEHMIAFGEEGASPRAGSVTLSAGLGLTNRVVIDQHFRQRDRLGRLLTALAYNPFAVGLGLDEDTAAFIGPDETVEVEGSGGVTIVDAADVSYSSMDSVTEGQPVCMLGLRLHVLVAGA
ncbi:MAG: cyanophycinase, partial [Gemmatimonadales bacterium]|nr:cyanophycinase [Gemmatimonadales bacterium]